MAGEAPSVLIARKTGDWWKDYRRHWCAYCGTKLEEAGKGHSRATRDHVVPRIHKGRHVTIPACRQCNSAKANQSLPEFLVSDYFQKARNAGRAEQWPLRDLWLAMALAAVELARSAELAVPESAEANSFRASPRR